MHFLLYMTPVPSPKNISESTSDKYNSQSLQVLSLALPLVALPGDHITKGFVQHAKEFGFYFEANGEHFKICKPKSDMGRFAFWEISLWLCNSEEQT